MVGIICALNIELEAFLEVLENKSEHHFLDKTFYQGLINNKECVLTVSGIGKMEAAITTSLMVEHFTLELVINSGIAGGYLKTLKTLDTVFATKVGCYDIDMVLDGLSYGCFSEEERFYLSSFKVPDGAISGIIMSSDTFAGDRQKLDNIFNQYFADTDVTCVDMESYAICSVLKRHNIPWIVIRTISDLVGETDQIKSYYNFPEQASHKSFQMIIHNYLS